MTTEKPQIGDLGNIEKRILGAQEHLLLIQQKIHEGEGFLKDIEKQILKTHTRLVKIQKEIYSCDSE